MTAVKGILDLCKARFELITVANEYNTTVEKIERARLKPFKGYDLPALNYWSIGMENGREYGNDVRALSLFVEYHSLTRDKPFIDIASELAADVVTALNRAVGFPKVSDDESIDLGGLVSDLKFDGYDYEIGEGQAPWCGVLVRFTVNYNTTINNMSDFSA